MAPERAARVKRITFPVVMLGLGGALIFALLGFAAPGRVSTAAAYVPSGRLPLPTASTPSPEPSSGPAQPLVHRSDTLPAWWPERLTLYTDSVGLGAVSALREVMPRWHVRVLGRPALMLDDAAAELARSGDRVHRVVVVALGYNSVWERHRADFDFWSARFDHDATRLLRVLRAAGARKIVWVTLRQAPASAIPPDSLDQHRRVAWYFPYVNERLRLLDRRFGDVVLADWSTVGDRAGITYDAIHLDPDGARLYAHMVKRAILDEPFTPRPPR